jgi:23S rRNA pseudouridine2605 synthase
VLARAGVSSRRAAEKLIAEGRVLVNGRQMPPGTKVVVGIDRVTLDGKPLDLASPQLVTYALNKPRLVVTTLNDPQGRRTVREFVSAVDARLFPVGRLDFDAEGLLLMTNDGELAYRLTHPKFAVSRTYVATVAGKVAESTIDRLRAGIALTDGVATPIRVDATRRADDATDLEIVVAEGRNHLIKRLCEAVGHDVRRLRRVEYGGVWLGRLASGKMRLLSDAEVRALRESAAVSGDPSGAD